MRAVDVGVGHDDDLLVAQILFVVMRAGAAAERLDEIGKLGVLRELVLAGGSDVENLAAQGQHGLRAAVARLLGRAAGRVALDDENLRAFRSRIVQSASLPGRRSLRTAVLRAMSFSWRRRSRSSARSMTKSKQLAGLQRIARQPMVERILDRLFDNSLRAAVARRSLVWPWNSGSRMNTESMQPAPVITSSLVTAVARFSWPARAA